MVLSVIEHMVYGLEPDGLRPSVKAGLPYDEARRSAPSGRTVRACTGATAFANSTWNSLPGGT
jgi:hypothetical protein